MAARKQKFQTDATRAKIRAAYLIRRLQLHVAGKINLSPTQIRAADILLRKIIPDLTQATITSDITRRYVAEVPPLLTKSEWLQKYGTKEEKPPLDLKAEPLALPSPVKNGQDVH